MSCCAIVVVCCIASPVQATSLYSASVAAFSEAEFESGVNPLSLIVVCGVPDNLEQTLSLAVEHRLDFTLNENGSAQVVANESLLIGVVDDTSLATLESEDLLGAFHHVAAEESLAFDIGDLLVFKADSLIWTIELIPGHEMLVEVATASDKNKVVPEPATIVLLGLGLFGVMALARRRRG